MVISYEENLTSLDVSNLNELETLELDCNYNLKELKGLENLENLENLTLTQNDIQNTFDLNYMLENAMLSKLKLDKKLYPILKNKYPDIDKTIREMKDYRIDFEWEEFNYEKEITSRDVLPMSELIEETEKYDINKQHDSPITANARDTLNKAKQYKNEHTNDKNWLEGAAQEVGNDYATNLEGDKAEIAKEFARLELEGYYKNYESPYNNETIDAGENPKQLLQIEKIDGIKVGNELNLGNKVYVATYEVEDKDENNQTVYKPIKEYYVKQNGVLKKIGEGTDEKVEFTFGNKKISADANKIVQGNEVEKITHTDVHDRIAKNTIEATRPNEKVTQISEILDYEFLSNLKEQCGIKDDIRLDGKTFIISTINEKGEENFDIVIRNDKEGKYESLKGMKEREQKGRQISVPTGITIGEGENGAQGLENQISLKEFETKSGNRYCITRDSEGKLKFNEIYRENTYGVMAETVDSHTYKLEDLTRVYEEKNITEHELKNAYNIINNTKQMNMDHTKQMDENNKNIGVIEEDGR